MNKYGYYIIGVCIYVLFSWALFSVGNFTYQFVINYKPIVLGEMVKNEVTRAPISNVQEVVTGDYRVMKGVYTGELGDSISDEFFLTWPVKGGDGIVTQCYSGEHPAIDIADRTYPKILAAAEGKVILADCLAENCPKDGEDGTNIDGLAHTVMIEHPNGFITVYGHLKRIFVNEGESVVRGDVIGQMGKSGQVDIISDGGEGVHLHFALLEDLNWTYLDPTQFLIKQICIDGEPDIEVTYGLPEELESEEKVEIPEEFNNESLIEIADTEIEDTLEEDNIVDIPDDPELLSE